MSWINTLRTSAEDLGTLAENEPPKDCALYWETGVVFCSLRKRVDNSTKTDLNQLSIPGYLIKKNQSRGARHGQTMRQTMYHKGRDMWEKSQKWKEWSLPHYSWKVVQGRKISRKCVWTRTDLRTNQTTRRTCLERPFLWSYTCRQATMGEYLIFVKRRKRIVNCTKNMLKVPAKELIPSISSTPNKTKHRQQFYGSEEYNCTVRPRTGWKYHFSTSSSSSSQWQQNDEWKSTQSWDYWRSSTWTEQWFFFVEKSYEHGRTCCRSASDSLFSCSRSSFSLAGNFQYRGIRLCLWTVSPLTQHF